MRSIYLLLLAIALGSQVHAQSFEYDANTQFPYGRPNPEAPEQIKDWDELVGTCACKSLTRTSQTEWTDTVAMVWRWKYIMNGWGVQDETLGSNGIHAGSIRQFNPDSSKWYVHYYQSGSPTSTLSAWSGNREEDRIVLFKPQKAPNGMEGFYRITFSDIKKSGFNWAGEWVNPDQSIVYPTFRIYCQKLKE